MYKNKTKEKLKNNQAVFGYICNIPAASISEIAGQANLDFIVIDCEHGPMNEETAENMIRAAEVVGITPLVRVPSNEPHIILRYMDRGAAGVIVPHINTKEEAIRVVNSVKYAPLGKRGFAPGRWTLNIEGDPFEFANNETLVICMVEDLVGIENLDEILSVEGLDVIHIGAGDIAQEMGFIGDTKNPKVVNTIHEMIQKIYKSGKTAGTGGIQVNDYENVNKTIELGARFLTLSTSGLLLQGTKTFLSNIK